MIGNQTAERSACVTDIDKNIGLQLKKCRIMQGLSQKALAHVVGVSIQQIQKYEQGINRTSSGTLYILAQFLNVPLTYFFTDNNAAIDCKAPLERERETLDVVKAYMKIKDPNVKARILSLIKSIADISV